MGDELALRAALGIVGLVLTSGGLALVFVPAAFVVAGLFLIAVAVWPRPSTSKVR